jgi:hypothetical protein
VSGFFVRWGTAVGVALGCVLALTPAAPAVTTGTPCSEKVVSSPTGVAFRILFANNGSVQQYVVTALAENPEAVNDARIALENIYGPASVNAPALKIISFKQGEAGGMMVPDKAIDSCGRTISFN